MVVSRPRQTAAFSELWRVAAMLMVVVLLALANLPAAAQPAFTTATSSGPMRNAKPLFWADGITRPDQLDNYARAGFNTVVIRLFWQPTADGSIVASDLEPQRAFAAQAAQQNLDVIYSLPPAPYASETKFSYSGDAGPYPVMWANWTQRAIGQLRDTPNLVGWMLPDDPRSLPFVNSRGFSRWVAANYGNVGVLNQQWNAQFESLESVSLSGARRLIDAWRGTSLTYGEMTDSQAREYLRQQQQRRPADNFAFHPAALALAHYQWDAYRGLVDFWAKTVRAADPQHRVFSGRLPDYAQLLSLPASVDVSVPSAIPGLLEPDLATHNPQAVDIARRGGRFLAVPVLASHLPGMPADTVARLLPSWMDSALAHGASGIAFDSWQEIASSGNLRRAVRTNLQRLQSGGYADLWSQAPAATAAVVLTPLADGITLRFNGQNAPLAALPSAQGPTTSVSRGVYGFADNMIDGEPSALTYALRWGTAFGAVDYLSPDELGGGYSSAKFGLLKKYGVVLLPQALSISPGMAQELASYVSGGGVIVTDLGVGAAQNGGQALGLPPELAAIFGVIPTMLHNLAFNLRPGQSHPLLPTWATQTAMNAKVLTSGDGPDGAAFAGPLVFGELLPGTVPLALAFNMTQRIPSRDPRNPNASVMKVNRSWLTLRPFGSGSAIFAPFRLWSLWRPGHPGFDGFHGDLFARSYQLSQLATPALTSTPVGTPEGTALFCEAVNFPNAIALINHNAGQFVPYSGTARGETVPVNTFTAPAETGTPAAETRPAAEAPAPAIVPDVAPAITASGLLTPLRKVAASNTDSQTATSDAVELTPEELEALFGVPIVPRKPKAGSQTPGNQTPGGAATASPTPSPTPVPGGPFQIVPDVPIPSTPTMPSAQLQSGDNPAQAAVVQTSGAEYFLWQNALCIFPVGPAPSPTAGRAAPLPPDSSEFTIGAIVRPPFYHPVMLHTFVPAMEMKVLRPLPIRVQHAQGGPLAANVLAYEPEAISLRVWPNTDKAFIRFEQWRLNPGREGTVKFALFDNNSAGAYRVPPGSRHRVAVSERSNDDGGTIRSTTNYTLTADNQGRLAFELTGTSIGVEISPLK